MVSPYLLRPPRSLEQVAAERTAWAVQHRAHDAPEWIASAFGPDDPALALAEADEADTAGRS
jgi:hypothetical protein